MYMEASGGAIAFTRGLQPCARPSRSFCCLHLHSCFSGSWHSFLFRVCHLSYLYLHREYLSLKGLMLENSLLLQADPLIISSHISKVAARRIPPPFPFWGGFAFSLHSLNFYFGALCELQLLHGNGGGEAPSSSPIWGSFIIYFQHPEDCCYSCYFSSAFAFGFSFFCLSPAACLHLCCCFIAQLSFFIPGLVWLLLGNFHWLLVSHLRIFPVTLALNWELLLHLTLPS